MIFEAGAAVEFLRGGVRALDFEVQRADARLATLFFGERERAPADAAAAELSAQEKLVHESVAPPEFEAEAEGDDEVARHVAAGADQEDATEPSVGEQLQERRARRALVKRDVLELVELAHQPDEQIGVGGSRGRESCFHESSVENLRDAAAEALDHVAEIEFVGVGEARDAGRRAVDGDGAGGGVDDERAADARREP